MAFWWPPCIPVGTQHFFGRHVVIWRSRGILVGTQCLFSWAHDCLVATWHLDGHPAFIFVHTCRFGGHLTSWWAPDICFGGHLAIIEVSTWRSSGHLASLCSPSISFGGHMVFWWPPGVLMGTQRLFWCATGILVGTQDFFSWCPPKF